MEVLFYRLFYHITVYSENLNLFYVHEANVQLRKTSIQTKEPQENGAKESFFQKPALKHVPQKEKSPPKKDHKLHNLPTLQKASERLLKNPPRRTSTYEDEITSSEEEDEDDIEIDKVIFFSKTISFYKIILMLLF